MNDTNKFSIESFPASRLFTMDIGVLGSRKHHVKTLVELDVTAALKKIRKRKNTGRDRVSFTSWILKCISLSLEKNKRVHALKKGRRGLVVFDDADISIMVEKTMNDYRVPVPYVIRETNKKTIPRIFEEIERVKNANVNDKASDLDHTGSKTAKIFLYLPQPIRLFIWKMMLRNPLRVKKLMGTSLVTSVGMFGNAPGWAIPFSIHPVSFTLGSIVSKNAVSGRSSKKRDILYMTVLFDHDVVDGAPAARFMNDLKELVESGHGL